jgi:hypothetical protein
MGEFGTEAIKKFFGTVIDLGMGFEDAYADDNKVKLQEAFSVLAGEALDILDIVRNIGQLKSELKEWDPTEREEVLQFVMEKLDLDNEKAEKVVERLLKIANEIAGLIGDLND